MKWVEIKRKYPNRYILLDDIKEEEINESKSRILSGNVVETSNDLKEIMKFYNDYKEKGKNVIYALPSTPDEFIIENVPFMGILR